MKPVRICLILGIIFAFGVSSCTGFFNTEDERFTGTEAPNETIVVFNNSANSLSASIYSSSERISKIATIPGRETSDDFTWLPNENGYSFYITFHLPLTERFTVSYIPPGIGKDIVEVSIPKDEVTYVVIPELDQIVGGRDERLFNDVYVVIKNNWTSGFRLTNPDIQFPIETPTISLVNIGDSALYKIPSTQMASDYRLTVLNHPNPIPMPAALTSFESGYLYVLDFRGGAVTLEEKKLLTLNNLAN